MTPLLLAAALAGSPAIAVYAQPAQDPGAVAKAACERLMTQTSAPNGVPFKKLNELPWAVFEHAVWRKVEGCPVREVVYKGETYYVSSAPPRLDASPAVEKRLTDHVTPLSPDAR